MVRAHMEAEYRLDVDATMATFAHPRYELVATGQIYDGDAQVRAYFAASRATFPDQRNELVALHHSDDAVIVEFDLLGREFRCRMLALYLFEDEGLVCERVYFDSLSILVQLGHLPGAARSD
jgi:ketosteroid isomerase-like protein